MPALPNMSSKDVVAVTDHNDYAAKGKTVDKSNPWNGFSRPRKNLAPNGHTPLSLSHSDVVSSVDLNVVRDQNPRYRFTPKDNASSEHIEHKPARTSRVNETTLLKEPGRYVPHRKPVATAASTISTTGGGDNATSETTSTQNNNASRGGKRTAVQRSTSLNTDAPQYEEKPKPVIFKFHPRHFSDSDPVGRKELSPAEAKKATAPPKLTPFCFKKHHEYVLKDNDPMGKKLTVQSSPPREVKAPWGNWE